MTQSGANPNGTESWKPADKVLALGALFVGLASLVAWLLRLKKGAANDDSPIIIKAGSFSVALLDDLNNVRVVKDASDDKKYEIHSSDFGTSWSVVLWTLEAGVPVDTHEYSSPAQIAIYLMNDGGDEDVDIVTMKYRNGTDSFVTLETHNDPNFGKDAPGNLKNVKKGARKHTRRVIHDKVNGHRDLNITKVEVDGQQIAAGEVVIAIKC